LHQVFNLNNHPIIDLILEADTENEMMVGTWREFSRWDTYSQYLETLFKQCKTLVAR
jgi:hypothetical protein